LSEYANAQDAHRVLTEDVKYLADDKRSIIADKERQSWRVFIRDRCYAAGHQASETREAGGNAAVRM